MAIVKMKKVSLVVLNNERKASLKKLRALGLVHPETVEGKGAVLSAYKEANARADKALSIIDEIKLPKKQLPAQVKISTEEADAHAVQIVALSDKKKALLDGINQGVQELDRLSKWGAVNPADFVALAEKGIFLYMYEIPQDKYALIGKDVKTVLVNTVSKVSRFLVVSETEVVERPKDLPPEAYSVPMPEKSTEEIEASIAAAKNEITSIDKSLAEAKKYRDGIADFKKALATTIEFETLFSGMEHEGLAKKADQQEPARSLEAETVEQALALVKEEEASREAKLAWLTGYVPVDSMKAFDAACKENNWAYAASDPTDEDAVPTKLKNNKLVSIIYPLTDFLDVTPGYKEFDISGWFLLFFCIFFAMIFGDTGYGAIIAILGLVLLGKSKKGARSLPALVTVLGVCTMVWGMLTCTWFGIAVEKLPQVLRDISFYPISAAKNPENYNRNQQVFCFMLALLQLSIAHIKCFVADRKSLKCLGDLGSLLQLWGMFYVVMSMVVDSASYPLLANGKTIPAFGYELPAITPTVCIAVLAFGFVLSFIFSNYEGSIGKSILESCKNIISVLLGIVNVFSDIVSYIRLWAVALAGAAISNTVNTMAAGIFGPDGAAIAKLIIFSVLAIVLLVFGHGLNMILNVLSVIVHGVRLNTLEFSQHLGMTWSGTKYSPFRETAEGEAREIRVEGLGKALAEVGKLGKF